MNAPSLQRLAVLSVLFHATLFAAGFWAAARQSTHFAAPPPYIVNLVTPDSAPMESASAPAPEVKQLEERALPKDTDAALSQKEEKRVSKKDEQKFRDKIASMETKNKAMKLAELRKKMRDINPSKGSATATDRKGALSAMVRKKWEGTGPAVSGLAVNDYIANVTGIIRGQFEMPPERKNKKLKTIVSIKIMTDGSIQIKRVQSSGNSLLDRKAQKAIKMASPLPRPPYEMEEMDLSFCPTEGARCE